MKTKFRKTTQERHCMRIVKTRFGGLAVILGVMALLVVDGTLRFGAVWRIVCQRNAPESNYCRAAIKHHRHGQEHQRLRVGNGDRL